MHGEVERPVDWWSDGEESTMRVLGVIEPGCKFTPRQMKVLALKVVFDDQHAP